MSAYRDGFPKCPGSRCPGVKADIYLDRFLVILEYRGYILHFLGFEHLAFHDRSCHKGIADDVTLGPVISCMVFLEPLALGCSGVDEDVAFPRDFAGYGPAIFLKGMKT